MGTRKLLVLLYFMRVILGADPGGGGQKRELLEIIETMTVSARDREQN